MKNKKIIKTIAFVFLGIVCLITGLKFFQYSILNYSQEIIAYEENNDVDYKVYLKENNFFETPYLEKDKIYITSLIDYIDINFTHNLKLDRRVNGKYKYYIKGIISATQLNNGNNAYWKKEFDLTEPKTVDYDGLQNILLNSDIKVDYQLYNDMLLEFKKTYNLSLDGNLKVALYVENVIDSPQYDDKYEKLSVASLNIPLTKATIEVPIEINNTDDTSIFSSEVVYSDDIKYTVSKIVGSVFLLGSVYFFLNPCLQFVRNREKMSSYKKNLAKILKTYDSIIVNSKMHVRMDGMNIVDVANFNELIDAHNEIRQPINFTEANDMAIFVLINNQTAWRYILRKDI